MNIFDSNDINSFALEYLKKDLNILPIKARTKEPLVKWSRYKNEMMTPKEAQVFFKEKTPEEIGIAIILGKGVIGIDFDIPELMPFILGDKDPREFTWVSESKKGIHVYLRAKIKENIEVPGVVEVKSKDKYLIAPPSIHPSGARYKWLTDITEKDIFELKGESTEILIRRIRFLKKHWKLIEIINSAWRKGQRNQIALFTAGALRKSGWNEEDVSDLLRILSLMNNDEEDRTSVVEQTYQKDLDEIAGISKLEGFLEEEEFKKLEKLLPKTRKQLKDIEIMEWLERKGTFFVDQQFEFYYKNTETVKIDSIFFEKIVRDFYSKRIGQIISKERLNKIKDESKSRALDHNYITFNRIGQKGDLLFYDLGKGKVVRISSDGWSVSEERDLFFVRWDHQTDQVEPISDDDFDIDGFLKMIFNLQNPTDYNLLKVYLISCFLPEIEHPLLSLFGSEGSGKTKFLEFIKRIVDPSIALTLPLSFDERNRNIVIFQNYLVCFDNLSQIDTRHTYNEISNQFSRVIVGQGLIERKLFTNKGIESYAGEKKIICINGINNLIKLPDLADRTLTFELERIYNPKPSDELEKAFLDGLPKLLGWIFNILSQYLRVQHQKQIYSLPRLAGFGKAGTVIADLIGWNGREFLNAFKNKILSLKFDLAGEDDLIQSITKFVREKGEWCGSSSELLNELSIDYVRNAGTLTKKLNKFKVILRELGIDYSYSLKGKERKRVVCLKLIGEEGDQMEIDSGDHIDQMRSDGESIGASGRSDDPYIFSNGKKQKKSKPLDQRKRRKTKENGISPDHVITDTENASARSKNEVILSELFSSPEREEILLPFKKTGRNLLKKSFYILEAIDSGISPKKANYLLKRGIEIGILKDLGESCNLQES